MAHVELSLTGSPPRESQPEDSLERWGRTAAAAPEPCLVIDSMSEIIAVSVSACELLGFPGQAAVVGRHLFGGILRLLDFTSVPSLLADSELEKIPPVLAFTSHRLARALMRVRSSDVVRTIDAVATPLYERDKVVGSLTFFCQV